MASFFVLSDIWKNLFSSSSWPKFDSNEASPYNLETYIGRVAHFYKILNPRTLLISDSQLKESLNALESYRTNPSMLCNPKSGEIDQKMNKMLWESKLMKQSIVHPDTNKAIFWAFRFSAFPVINIPLTTLLLFPGSTHITVLSQFLNQTYNVAVNYANRNASNPMSNSKLCLVKPLFLSPITYFSVCLFICIFSIKSYHIWQQLRLRVALDLDFDK